MESKKTTKMDSWSEANVKTLQDLFDFERKQLDLIAKQRERIAKETDATQRALLQKQLKDFEKEFEEMEVRLNEIAVDNIREQFELRQDNYKKEYAEYKALLETQTKLSEKQRNKQLKALQKSQKIDEKNQRRRDEIRGAEELARAKQNRKATRDSILETSKYVWGGAGSVGTQMVASLSKVGENIGKSIGKAFNDISNKINSMMETYSKYQSAMDARLQGSGKTFLGLQSSLKSAVGASPYLKTENMLNNLQTLVEAGISTNLEQRAFLQTIKDKVAQTFDASNAALLRIIRLQQRDSTAARLGMEAYLTRMFNQWMENTEYLTSTFDSVQESLLEASSIMSAGNATEFEFIVQKWLGSLVGRGMSDTTATSLAAAIGMLGSGNVTGLSGNAMNNLLVMAAARAGLDYGELLMTGLNSQNTNQLMQALVRYMQEINASGSNVVRSQYAQTFGLTISDLMAASGLQAGMEEVANTFFTYNEMYSELADQLNQVQSRTHIAEKISNLFENAQFSLASNIAGNTVMAAMWKVTDMIQGVTGGINIPMISVMGTAIDLETTVENLMKLGLVGIGSLGMISDVITGLGNAGSNFSNTLSRLGIGYNADDMNMAFKIASTGFGTRGVAKRGRGGLGTSQTMSFTPLASNADTEDIYEQTLNTSMDESKQKQAEAAAGQDDPMGDLRTYFLDVFDVKFNNLLFMVAHNGGYTEYANPLGEQPLMIGDRSMVKTTYTVGGEDSSKFISSISENVSSILDILANRVIKVSIDSVSGEVPTKDAATLG